MTQWIIVAIAIAGLIFNSGVLWNDVRHLKKSNEKLWEKFDGLEKWLLEHHKDKQ